MSLNGEKSSSGEKSGSEIKSDKRTKMTKLRTKFTILSILTSLLLTVAIFVSAWLALMNTNNSSLELLEKTMRDDFDRLVQMQVETAVSTIDSFYQQSVNGRITEEEARQLAADAVREMRYGEDGYFWIDTYEGVNVVLLGGDAEGKLRIDSVDANGVSFMKDIINNGRQEGGGFSNYDFPRAGETEPAPKRSYSLAYEPFQWVIGTGNYTDDIDEMIAAERSQLNQRLLLSLATIAVISAVVLVLILILSSIFTSRTTKPVEQITEAANKLKNGDIDVKISITSSDEIGVMAHAFSEMVEYFQQRAEAMKSVAHGDLSKVIEIKSENDVLTNSINEMTSTLNDMVGESKRLTEAAARGDLMTRGDAARFEGAYYDIVNGINQTLEGITVPMQQAFSIMDSMTVNDYTKRMSKDYQGMLLDFANSVNNVQERLIGLQNTLGLVARGDFSSYQEYVDIGQMSSADELTPSIIKMMRSVMALAEETENIAQAAVSGNLDYRGDESAFAGSYAEVVSSLNLALDNIAKPINQISGVLLSMADGDLSIRMEGSYEGKYAVMQEAINSTVMAMHNLISEIANAAEQVASGSQQVSEGSMSLSQGSTEQASSVEELSASLTEIASQTRQNASFAGEANALANTASKDADRGNNQMQEMLEAMSEINTASANIAKIIKVIDDIAFQTNILALNAAVEAARAGQHGKGFAVVAEEVRNLAARSAEAAKETTEFIETTIAKVNGGTGIANDTAQSLHNIVEGILKVAKIVDDIANASNEQASGIAQINQGIDQVSKVVQANSATAEQSAAASEELRQQAQYLTDNIGQFKL